MKFRRASNEREIVMLDIDGALAANVLRAPVTYETKRNLRPARAHGRVLPISCG
jgi:hypothetical protein